MNSLSNTNHASSSSSNTFSRKRSNPFLQEGAVAPALRSGSVKTPIDEPVRKIATRLIRSKSEKTTPSIPMTTEDIVDFSESVSGKRGHIRRIVFEEISEIKSSSSCEVKDPEVCCRDEIVFF